MGWKFYNASGQSLSSTTAAATQAEMEAGSLTNVYVSPGRAKYHPGVAKGYGRFNSGGTLQSGSVGISSTSKSATGQYLVNWDPDFDNTEYMAVGSVISAAHQIGITDFLAANVEIKVKDNDGSAVDNAVAVVAFGVVV